MFFGDTLDIIFLSFVAVGTFIALINVFLSIRKPRVFGSHGRRTKRWLRISAILFFIYMAISLSSTVLSNMIWGDGSYRDPANELQVLGTTIGSLSFSAIVHAQLKLTFDLYDKDTSDNRNKSFGLFMSPQILNLIYFVVTHIRLYAENLPSRGFQTVSNVSSITFMLVPFFIWVASVISLVFTLIYAARTQVPVPRGAFGCLLASSILSVIRHTWLAILNILYFVASRTNGRLYLVFPDYFSNISIVITVWFAALCVLLLIVGSSKGLRGREPWRDEYSYGPAVSGYPPLEPAPIHMTSYGRAY
ncbi:unnamed protein product [Clonostachys rhizophaga]|uniref:Uncharacterized protein n=1 Tax=Clonostachys rhizophaga TaxID=160324 RepID=A0A9N9VS37_9HYPO|nr:unnamed protein product [Clonostachys rhizophaga]